MLANLTYYLPTQTGLDRRNNSPRRNKIRVNSGNVELAVVGIELITLTDVADIKLY